MAFQLPALPNFQTNIPQVDPTQQLTRLAGLRALLSENQLRQQLAPLQVQEATQRAKQAGIQTELSQTQLDSQKAMMQAIASGELNKYAGVETEDGSGFDAAGAYQHLISKGVLPAQAGEYTNSWLSIGQKQAEISKTLGQAGEAQQNIREKTLKQVAAKLGDIGDMTATKAAPALDKFRQDLVNNPKAYPGLTRQEMSDLFSADLGHLDALEGHLGIAAQVADFHKSKSAAAKEETEATEAAAEATGKVTPKMATAQRQKIQLTQAEAQARQQAMQGDPNAAGQLLASGALTLAELKTRGTTPKFIEQATLAAQKLKPDYNPADEVIAEQVAKSPATNQFFGSANSLIGKGGTLDQLEKLGKNIPQHDWPIINTIDDWQKLARGKGPLAGYAATALGVADDYGKVMGGGNASDNARNSALALFSKAASPEQRADAIAATRDAVQSQRDSRIGNNQFLRRQYGTEVSKGTGGAPAGKTYTQADVDAAVAAGHGTAAQIEAAFKAKNYTKQK